MKGRKLWRNMKSGNDDVSEEHKYNKNKSYGFRTPQFLKLSIHKASLLWHISFWNCLSTKRPFYDKSVSETIHKSSLLWHLNSWNCLSAKCPFYDTSVSETVYPQSVSFKRLCVGQGHRTLFLVWQYFASVRQDMSVTRELHVLITEYG